MKSCGHRTAIAALLSFSTQIFAFQQPANPRLPNFDNRSVAPVAESTAPEGKAAAVGELRARLPSLKVEFHAITRSPKIVLNRDGFLSGPQGSGAAISQASLAGIPANDPHRITKAFIREHSKLFGHGPEALEKARITREFVGAHNGLRTVVWEQQVNDVPVFEAVLISHTTAQSELVNIASQFMPNPDQAADHGATNRRALLVNQPISAKEAVAIAARNAGETADTTLISSLGASAMPDKTEKFKAPFLLGETQSKLIWLPMDEQTLRLCWDVTLTSRKRGEMFRVLVDAETGVVQVRHNLTEYLQDATYRVFTSDSPSPFSPGYSTPVTNQPPQVSRSLVTLPALNTNASPLGWINDGGNETLGNNVDAHTDINNDDLPDLPRPQGSPARVFDFPMDLTTQNPSAYSQAAVVQLFYWNNFMHDKLYELGFTEAAGNFQSNNFGRGGLGNDAVQADAQDGGGFNNANFSTPADGSPGRMQMYIFNGPTPQRDGDLDAEVVLHEYTHGLSNRRVGGGVGISALQPSGMGEGWSDFYALSLLSEAGDDVNGVYAAGGYVTYQLSGLTQNYYFGIRRYPYCTDMTKNPLTFKDIDPGQASAHTGIPRSSIIGTTANEVHNMGEVWCVTLWDARANIITKYGWAAGNQRMLQLVTDGMNLSPANPTFLQARDAIIQADLVDYGGADRAQLWTAFAKRGMGISATSPASSTTTGLVEAYDVPDDLQISPAVLSSSGPVGGPFTPNPASFTLLNAGSNTLNWSLNSTSAWFTVSPTNGTLAAGSNATVFVLLGAVATNFSLGSTSSTVWFTNRTSGIAQARTFGLSVVGRTLFENFEPDIHLPLWSSFGGTLGSTVIATNYGGSVSGVNSLWFGDAGTRYAATIPVNTSAGGSLSFYLRLGNGASAPWETVDIPAEGIVLEYSTNSGTTWTLMGTYDTATFYNWTQVTTNIPVGALSAATQFRWRQLSHSGTCCDHWALDDISIDAGPTPPAILVQPISQTIKSGSNVTFAVSAQGSFPLAYRWQKNGTNIFDGGRISGTTNAILNISTALESDGGQYAVVITNNYGSVTSLTATLLVTPLDHFEWSTIPSPQAVGTPFSATLIARDFLNATVTNFTGVAGLSGSGGGGQSSNAILGNLVYTTTGSGLYTLGFAFTPNTNMVVTHVRSYSGTKVSIWQTNGTLLAAQNVNSIPGSWVETPLATPLMLNAGVTYVVGYYTANASATYYMRTDRTNTFPNGTIVNAYYYSSADAYPSNVVTSQTVFLVDLRYTVNSGAPVVLSPASTGPFTNGVWSGPITVQTPGTNVVLRADEAGGHSGSSSAFDVLLQNDLSISITDSPDPVPIGGTLTYSLTVANVGPATSTGVMITNILPPGVNFISATSSQGSCTRSRSTVTCNAGAIPGGTNMTITIVVVPNSGGVLTNTAVATRAEADPYPPNNTAVAITTVQAPVMSISDCTLLEGNFGTTNAIFTVTLNIAPALPVLANYSTANGTALAGIDYISTNGTIAFTPGQTNKTIVVAVKGDTVGEPDETFFVNLSAVANATLAKGVGIGTILNDDVPSAAYVRSTVGAPWGSTSNEMAMNRVFGTNNWQDLRYETLNPGVLFSSVTTFLFMEGSDIDATEMETFLGTNISSIQTWVSNGGNLFLNAAPNEDNGMDFGFGVTLVYPDDTSIGVASLPSHPIFNGPFTPVTNAWTGSYFAHATVTGTGLTTLITNSANGHIVLGEKTYGRGHVLFGGMTTDNFHTPQPQASNLRANIIAYLNALSAYHFEWSAIPSPQQINMPFVVTITARDATNGVMTSFNGVVGLTALAAGSNAVAIAPSSSDNFTNGVWTGSITVQQPVLNVVLNANDGGGHTGGSNPFDVVAPNDISLTLIDSPDPVSVGANLTYTLTITNTGPAPATSVSVTNVLPANVAFVSAAVSQGTWSQSSGLVVFSLGAIPGATNASASTVVVPAVSGAILTNSATVYRGESDGYVGNNTATTLTTVIPPAISVADTGVVEGNIGSTNMLFAVTLNVPSAQTITVSYATGNGTALAGSDYIATNGILTFAPGTTNQNVLVSVLGDVVIENNETFFMNLSSPINAVLARSQAVGTITNDDGLPGRIDHLAWQPISSPQMTNLPFGVTLSALDASNTVVTNFTGTVNLSAPLNGGNPITPTVSGAFSNGVWSGNVAVQVFATNLILRADDGDGHLGLSNPFHVINSNQPPVVIASPSNTVAYLGGAATFQANILASAPLSYQWKFNGVDIPAATNSVLNLNRVTLAQAGNYSLVVWNPYGTNSTSKGVLSVLQVVAWGAGTNNTGISFNYGQSIVPATLTNAVQLSGGLYHSLAVRADGTVSAWGAGTNNLQQNPHYGQSAVPTLGSAMASAAGGYHSIALRGDGTLAAWGAGTNNLLSLPFYGQCLLPSAASNIIATAAGDYHSAALRNDGRVLVWGYNGFGQTNVPTTATSNVVAIASRASHVLALKSDGSLVHWGSLTTLPVGVSNIVTIAAGVNHCLALKSDGTVVAFGSQATVPAGLSNVVDVATGSDHNLALRSDGTVVTWGTTNLYGRDQVPGLSNFVGIACGYYHSLGILGDGSPVIKWQPISRSVLLSNAVSFYVMAVGTQLTYQWQLNGIGIPGATNSTYNISAAQALDAGNYRVVLGNSFGAITSAVANLSVVAPIGPAVDAPSLTWTASGNAAWFGEINITHDGSDAAQSGRITDGQQSSVQTTVSGPGVLNFWWKVSSEQFFDLLSFSVDSSQQASLSGEVDWQLQTFSIASGTHTLRWTYQKDGSVSAGSDAAWLDQVLYTTNPPIITLQPFGQTNSMGAGLSLNAAASGAPPITYQWLKAGTNLPGAVSSTLNIVNATRHDSATYAVIASNPGGSTPSSNAVVLVRVPQRLNAQAQTGAFVLTSGDADGGLLLPGDLGNLQLQVSSNLVDWAAATNNLILTNGTLLMMDRDIGNFRLRFYRFLEH